ncbi:MAG: sialate O-acetylesterase, partial [Cyanobacteria bacterium J06555_13]
PSLRPDAEAWAEKFAIFAYNFRQDVGEPNLPLVYAQLGQPEDLEGLPNWELVQQQQENIQIPNGQMIETDDLPMDGIHYTADSYKVIGQRFADAIAAIQSGRSPANASQSNPNGESPAPESAQ